ncbi:MAG: hypothetical protein P0Y59_14990 [Candidatus Sphingomonas phytovorans]|nr:hypothetical protein [Sphingomonas sp.]WEJ98248.1 MAG: hypothetical protein P0Y59_14990 [Sphingomonas sp.]
MTMGGGWVGILAKAPGTGGHITPVGLDPLEQIARLVPMQPIAIASLPPGIAGALRFAPRILARRIGLHRGDDHLGRGARRKHRVQDGGIDHARSRIGHASRATDTSSPPREFPNGHPAIWQFRASGCQSDMPHGAHRPGFNMAPTPIESGRLACWLTTRSRCLFLLCSRRKFPTLQARN